MIAFLQTDHQPPRVPATDERTDLLLFLEEKKRAFGTIQTFTIKQAKRVITKSRPHMR